MYAGLACHCTPHPEVDRQPLPTPIGHLKPVHFSDFIVCSSSVVHLACPGGVSHLRASRRLREKQRISSRSLREKPWFVPRPLLRSLPRDILAQRPGVEDT